MAELENMPEKPCPFPWVVDQALSISFGKPESTTWTLCTTTDLSDVSSAVDRGCASWQESHGGHTVLLSVLFGDSWYLRLITVDMVLGTQSAGILRCKVPVFPW